MLFNIMPLPNKDAMIIAANLELPFIVRPKNPENENKSTVKTEYILKNGSHHGRGLEVLFAHEYEKYYKQVLNSITILKTVRESNFAILAKDPGNIAAIMGNFPASADCARTLEIAFGKENCQIDKNNVFAYFSKKNERIELKEITPSHTLIAEIFDMLQRCNRIEPSEELAKKMRYILSGGSEK
ncbi:hypothetical protein IKM56_04360 [Candidatus Saccharibacteria bacterium]|nr:hypothetical protein [Candidatus Saccharibacteria bacterium]